MMGNQAPCGPNHAALADLGVPEQEVARVHRHVGMKIGLPHAAQRSPCHPRRHVESATVAGRIHVLKRETKNGPDDGLSIAGPRPPVRPTGCRAESARPAGSGLLATAEQSRSGVVCRPPETDRRSHRDIDRDAAFTNGWRCVRPSTCRAPPPPHRPPVPLQVNK